MNDPAEQYISNSQEAAMRKQVIHIYGASGSGTTTLGKRLSERLGYTFMDTDDYFWLPTDPPYREKRPVEERIALMRHDLDAAEHAVISGSLVGWGDVLMPYFTLAVRVVTEQDIRIRRLRRREREHFGMRILPGGDMHEEHEKFIAWASKYDTGDTDMRSRAEHDLWEKLLPCRRIVVDGVADLEKNCERVEEMLCD